MGLKFVGSIDTISERQLAFIKEILEKESFSNTTVTIKPVGIAGDNYVANVKRIIINENTRIFTMIAKIAPQSEIMRTMTNAQMLFMNEHIMYSEILPKFQELEQHAGVPNADRLRIAKCYGSCAEAPHEVILLEDLQITDFIMLDRFKPLSNECVKSVFKNLAHLHSLSFALKFIEPETYKIMKEKLSDLWTTYKDNVEMLSIFSQLEKDTESMLGNEEHKRVFKGAITDAIYLAAKVGKTETDAKHSVIQHGDAWTNNLMFKFYDNKIQDSIMIDYQQSKENNPVCDIQYMIFNCTNHNMRSEHFHDWMDYYHSELDNSLSNFGLKATCVYPREQLDVDMKRHGKLMFGLSITLAALSTLKSEDAGKVKDALEAHTDGDDLSQSVNFTTMDQNHNLMYHTKVIELIDSYVELGLLNPI